MKNLYFFDDKGISTLVKTVIKKLFESPNYINMRKQISSLREDVDKVSVASNEIIRCPWVYGAGTYHDFNYPVGFNNNNTIVVGSYSPKLTNGIPGQFGFTHAIFYSDRIRIYLAAGVPNPGTGSCIYVVKKPSV